MYHIGVGALMVEAADTVVIRNKTIQQLQHKYPRCYTEVHDVHIVITRLSTASGIRSVSASAVMVPKAMEMESCSTSALFGLPGDDRSDHYA